jgi:hypothetical protein
MNAFHVLVTGQGTAFLNHASNWQKQWQYAICNMQTYASICFTFRTDEKQFIRLGKNGIYVSFILIIIKRPCVSEG